MKANFTHLAPVQLLGAVLLVLGCADKAKDCNITGTCPDGTVDGGGNGGTGFGGATSMGGTAGTGGSSSACKPACTGTKPACNTSTKTCVECTADSNCSGSKPACNTGTNACVQCTQDGNCPSGKPLCDTSTNVCVQCKSNADCTDAAASLCSSGTCSPCATDTDCSHIGGKNACKTAASGDAGVAAGTCVQCTVSNESACGANSCDPSKNTCTNTPTGSVGKCQSCVADSECIGNDPADGGTPTARCVPMTFNGSPHRAYCLQRFATVSATGCKQPYVLMPDMAASASGAAAEQYCGINQSATTCEAVLDLISGTKTCALDTDCGQGEGGLCKTVGGSPNHCTIPCNTSAECVASPSPGSTCTTDVPYCH